MRRVGLIVLVLMGPAWASAEDVVQFDPGTGAYQGCRSLDPTVWATNPGQISTALVAKAGFLYLPGPNGCQTLLPGVPDRYRKVEQGQVMEMDATEKALKDGADQTARRVADRQAAVQRLTASDRDAQVIRVKERWLLDQLNVLRQAASLPALTPAEAQTAQTQMLQRGDGEAP